MMISTKPLMHFVWILCIIVSYSDAKSILDTLSDEDKMIYAEYDQHHRNSPVEDLAITQLICDHIKSTSPTVVANSFVLFNRLNNKHKEYFDDVFIDYLIKELSTGMTYAEYLDKESCVIRCLVALGKTRTEKSIVLLFELMEPYESWPQSFEEALKSNLDQTKWITKIRKYSLDSLLEPQDKKGEELLPIINIKLNSFESGKAGYIEMKQAYDFYSEHYQKLRQEGKIQ